MDPQLRERALAKALEDPARWLRALRTRHTALERAVSQAQTGRRVGLPLGAVSLVGGATLAALTLTTTLTSPLGWIAAGLASALGLGTLTSAASAERRGAKAQALLSQLRGSHAGRILEVEALIGRMDTARAAMGTDYARYETRLLREVPAGDDKGNAALLATLRGRQLTFVRRLDEARRAATALHGRLVRAAIEADVDERLARVAADRETYEDRLARSAFAESDAREEVARLASETAALESLEREFALP